MILKKRSRQLFYSSLITYVVIFSIPLLIFANIVYHFTKNSITDNILQTNKTAAVGVIDKFAKILNNTYATANVISIDRYFSSATIRSFGGSFVYIDKSMQSLSGMNNDFSKLAFYSSESNMIYTNSIYDKDFYFSNILKTENNLVKSLMPEIAVPTWVEMESAHYNEAKTNIATFLYPVEFLTKDGVYSCSSMLLFHMDSDKIHQLMSAVTTIAESHAVLYYKNKPILSSSAEIFHKLSQMTPEGAFNLTEYRDNDINYTVSVSQKTNEVQIVTLIPSYFINSTATDIMVLYFLALGLTVIIGFVLIYFGSRYNYKPISSLVKKLSELNVEIPTSLNEVETASFVMDNLISNNKTIEGTNLQLKLSRMLLRIINNSASYCYSDSFFKRCKELCICFDCKYYCCFILSFDSTDIDFQHNFNDHNYTVYSTENIENNSFSCIICADENNEELIYHFISTLKYTPQKIGIGSFVESISEISNSYKHAYCAGLNTEENKTVYKYLGESAISSRDVISQFTKEVELLYRSIINKDKSRITFSIHNISNLIQLNLNPQNTEMIVQTLIFHSIKALNTIAPSSCNVNLEFFNPPVRADSETIVIWLEQFIGEISSFIQPEDLSKPDEDIPSKPESAKSIDYILLYINMNYYKPDFSIKALADELHMSVSNLSHYFKNRQKVNISDYINRVKINEAKRLLLETDILISDIVPQIGYSHVSSFTKMFKLSEGITPSEFKQINKKR